MRPGSLGWWSAKVRQARRHVAATITARERDSLVAWLRPAELAIFDGNPHLARWFITRVNPAELAPAERPVWLGLVLKLDLRRT